MQLKGCLMLPVADQFSATSAIVVYRGRHEEVPFMCWAPHVDGSGVGMLSVAVFGHKCMSGALSTWGWVPSAT